MMGESGSNGTGENGDLSFDFDGASTSCEIARNGNHSLDLDETTTNNGSLNVKDVHQQQTETTVEQNNHLPADLTHQDSVIDKQNSIQPVVENSPEQINGKSDGTEVSDGTEATDVTDATGATVANVTTDATDTTDATVPTDVSGDRKAIAVEPMSNGHRSILKRRNSTTQENDEPSPKRRRSVHFSEEPDEEHFIDFESVENFENNDNFENNENFENIENPNVDSSNSEEDNETLDLSALDETVTNITASFRAWTNLLKEKMQAEFKLKNDLKTAEAKHKNEIEALNEVIAELKAKMVKNDEEHKETLKKKNEELRIAEEAKFKMHCISCGKAQKSFFTCDRDCHMRYYETQTKKLHLD